MQQRNLVYLIFALAITPLVLSSTTTLASNLVSIVPQVVHTTLDLDLKDYDDLVRLIQKETRQCYQEDKQHIASNPYLFSENLDENNINYSRELTECLEKTISLVLSRRDQNDHVQRDLLPKTILELPEDQRLNSLQHVTEKALSLYKKGSSLEQRATGYEQLKNLLAEYHAKLRSAQKDIYVPLLHVVVQAKAEVPGEMITYRANHGGGTSPSPSLMAEKILENIESH